MKDVAKKVSQAISVKVEKPKPTPKPNKVASTIASAIKAAANAIKEVVAPVKKVSKKIEKSVAQLQEPCPEPKSNGDLDKLQFVLDMVGFIPAVGDICDGINALIYYARGMHLDAMISVGCIVFTLFADTLLKPLKWAGGKAVDIAKKISDKLPNFAKETCGFLKRLPGKIKSIPLVNKCYDTVKNISTKLSNYIDDLFKKAKKIIDPVYTGKRQISDTLYGKLRKKTPNQEIRNMVNKNINELIGTPDEALGEIITGRLEADHIISMDKITQIEGFGKLSVEQQIKLLNDPKNFQGLTKSANASKGSKSYKEWTMHKSKGIKVNEEFRQKMIKKENELEQYFLQEVKRMLASN